MATIAAVNVFDHDSGLLAGLSAEERESIRLHGRVPSYSFQPGEVDFSGFEGNFALLILEGFLSREATVVARTSVEVLGPGDVLRPWEDERAESPVPVASKLRALHTTEIGVLSPGFLGVTARWPAVFDTLCSRLLNRARWLAMQAAVAQLPRIEDRVLVLMWHLADRWGRVERDGTIVCPIRLTHAQLAGIVASRRPTVTTALTRLASEGRVTKQGDGFALHGPPPTSAQVEGQTLADAFRLRTD